MKEIDGVKYITEKEFDQGVQVVLEDVFEFIKSHDDISKSTGALLIMVLMSEFASLGVEIFDKNSEEKEKKEDK